MNEERSQDYLNLIDALLRCPSGEEPQILNTNRDLVDAELVEAMLQVANELIAKGNLDAANSLMNLAGQLMGVYGNTPLQRLVLTPSSSPLPKSDSQVEFLLQVLQATVDSQGDPQVVYPLLQANLDLLDDNFAQLLQRWARARLSEVKPEQAPPIAAAICNFSSLICQFPLGNRANSLEIAITSCEVTATVFTRQVQGATSAL